MLPDTFFNGFLRITFTKHLFPQVKIKISRYSESITTFTVRLNFPNKYSYLQKEGFYLTCTTLAGTQSTGSRNETAQCSVR
jgi:hypothetical protein